MVGKPLRVDESTADIFRPGLARVCVELDLLKPKVSEVFVGTGYKSFMQQIIYENCPHYCCFCRHIGHEEKECIEKNKGEQFDVEKQKGNEEEQKIQKDPTVGNNPENCVSIPQPTLDVNFYDDSVACELISKHVEKASDTRDKDLYLFEKHENMNSVFDENCNQIEQFG
ncbi:UNVERIFIED_CONTAM: hypothetical protein Slati_1439200 [Sesamum latifolium]|uniref:Zinc knuckle CX2CX4HX4C domain-containing protein n=1 Tax=Sesamum latifolium TaxID=2727402 RepID=A0AAW2X4K8_9LAMI